MEIALGFSAGAAFIVAAVLGLWLVPFLRRMKFGQTILDIGPAWHKSKGGTPVMGGLMFIAGTLLAFTAGLVYLWNAELISFDAAGTQAFTAALSGFVMAVCMGFIGFSDDYIKIKKRRNEGLSVKQKLILQVLVVAAYFTVRYMSGNTSTAIDFPFIGTLELSFFYYIISGLVILYLVNAVNLTDGVDGLCGSVSVVYTAAFAVIAFTLRFYELSLLSVCVGGAVVGFLVWNLHPAKIFMGDTGSLFLGGIVCALGFGCGTEVLMILAAAVYIWEALTVVIQVVYFKLTHGKRLFKMTPIHHSFEKSGWKESGIVMLFSFLSLVAGGVAVAINFLRL
ncbi:MAG: phospho-N-acetylmuramoyl-pentapeptide-transferase [Oscillospiraceae bacterium]|jgi:phospho-N-acetylmuramoyl-pentapeptide-transferase|nr:phospho-N-acetylmuramoyl-pentapeptide-transferase [Oscillospiraceae bacterium]